MVAVSLDYTVNNTDDTSEDTSFTATMTASAALADTDEFFVLSMVNFRPETDGVNARAQFETRFGTTRIGVTAFWNAFMQFNTGDAASATTAGCMAVLTGDGSDTINYRQQSINGTAGRGNRVSNQQLAVINLTEFGAEDTDWFYGETTNEDAASATPTGTTFVRAGGTSLGTNVVQSGEIEFTPGTTGDYQLIAYVEGFFTASATAAENLRARLVMVEDPDSAATTTTIAYEEVVGYDSNAADPEDIRRPFLFFDARELTSGTEYRFQIEVGNTGTATEADYSRFRILALRLDRFTDYSFITNANNATAASGEDACDNDLTFNFDNDPHDVLVIANSASASDETNWGHRVLREDPSGTPVNYPDAGGRFNAFNGAEQFPSYHMACLEGNTGSTTMQMLVATDGSDTHRYGQNLAESAAVRGFLCAIMLDVPADATNGVLAAELLIPASNVDGVVATQGALAANLLIPTSNVDGVVATQGVLDTSLPLVTAAFDGSLGTFGIIDADLLIPTSNVDGVVATQGIIGADLLIPTVNVDGVVATQGALATDLPLLTANFDGVLPLVGVIGAALLIPTADFAGRFEEIGDLAASLLIPTAAFAGNFVASGILGADLLIPTSNVDGIVATQGALAAALLIPTSNVDGVVATQGALAANLLLPTSDHDGVVATQGDLDASLLVPTSNFDGTVPTGVSGALAASLLIPTSDHAGTVFFVLGTVNFDGVGALTPTASLNAFMNVGFDGVGAYTPSLTRFAELAVTLPGSGAVTPGGSLLAGMTTTLAGVGAFTSTADLIVGIDVTFDGVGVMTADLTVGDIITRFNDRLGVTVTAPQRLTVTVADPQTITITVRSDVQEI